jgi:hypothetical protein
MVPLKDLEPLLRELMEIDAVAKRCQSQEGLTPT